MKSNIGTIDRTLRILAAVVVATLSATNVVSGAVALVLGAVAALLIVTSLLSVCPLYLFFGLSSRRGSY